MSPSGNKPRSLGDIPYNERDINIVYALFAARFMTTWQVWFLFFRETTTSLKACQVRLRKLKTYGLLRCIEPAYKRGETRPHNIWAITKLGGELLVQERGVPPEQIDTTPWEHEDNNHKLLHLINTTNIRLALVQAAAAEGMTLAEWVDERELRSQVDLYSVTLTDPEGQPITRTFTPDAFFTLSREGKHAKFWAEMDQSTIDLEPSSYQKRSIISKMRMMLAWEKSEPYQQAFGTRPLRYLMVTTGHRRLHHMLAVAAKVFQEEVGYREDVAEDEKREKLALVKKLDKKILITTLDAVTTQNILTAPIWYTAGRDTPCSLFA